MTNIMRRNPNEERSLAWDPFQLMREMMSWEPFRAFEAMSRGGAGAPGSFNPHFEAKETADGFVIKADLPGVAEKDLDVSLTGNRLTISGTREAEQRQEGTTYYTYECSYGSFTRAFTLPDSVDADHVEAELANGVLTVHLPKKAELKSRKISLKGIVDKVKSLKA